MVAVGATGLRSSAGLEQICSDCNEIDEHAGDAFSEPLTLCICKRQQHMRTDGSQPSCLSAKKTKRSTNDDCSIRKKQPNLKPKPSRLQILRPAKRPARATLQVMVVRAPDEERRKRRLLPQGPNCAAVFKSGVISEVKFQQSNQ